MVLLRRVTGLIHDPERGRFDQLPEEPAIYTAPFWPGRPGACVDSAMTGLSADKVRVARSGLVLRDPGWIT